MVTLKYLYDVVNARYGGSYLSIAELADELGITYTQANELTIAAGFRRHKRSNPPVTLEDFELEPAPQRIQMLL